MLVFFRNFPSYRPEFHEVYLVYYNRCMNLMKEYSQDTPSHGLIESAIYTALVEHPTVSREDLLEYIAKIAIDVEEIRARGDIPIRV